MTTVGVAIIGAGQIALANHLPGLKLLPNAKLVALCDSDENTLRRASDQTGIKATFTDYNKLLEHDGVDAVVIATPNFTHPPIAMAAAKAGKHVMSEKPLGLNFADALAMLRAAEDANVRHMTAFTYRFVPAMRYMQHLIASGAIGTPYHFRAQRFQDWGDRSLGWRQVKKLAGTGEMGDMLSHRIDYAHMLIGPMTRLVADLKTFIPTRGGKPSDVDDWVAMITDFGEKNVTGVLESTKLATGRGEGHRGQDTVEVNGSEGTIVYSTQKPIELQIGKNGDADLRRIDVPREFLVYPKSPREPGVGDPLVTFRYDQTAEFIDAIVNARPCRPSFKDGARAQAVMDAALQSAAQRRWVVVAQVP
ncbi:MAG: Gfo/Idh/MocA family oxidoreductase [Planctomycetota bacterium]|nr:Gfo/Idh/MocA family oxidoreductase [Planctomycetota bacterium]